MADKNESLARVEGREMREERTISMSWQQ